MSIQTLANARPQAGGTTLVTLLLPAKYPIGIARQKIQDEIGTASNIKSRVTRQHVQRALRSLQQTLKATNAIPETGMALFSGSYI